MRLQNSVKLAAVVTGVLSMAGVSFGQSFMALPAGANVTDITDDGSMVVGLVDFFDTFYWTADSGFVRIGTAGSPAVSDDGSTIVGRAPGPDGKDEAAIWVGGTEWEVFGNVPDGESCDNFRSSFWGTSGDGSVSVGLAWVANCRAHAFT